MDSRQMLFALLRMQICGTKPEQNIHKELSQQMLDEVYSLAQKQDLAHIAGQALSDLGCLGDDEISLKLKKQAMLAVYRYAKMQHDLETVCAILEKAGIPHMPLKGAVIRKYYPQAWMRTSCDIDIFVPGEHFAQAREMLQDKQGYQYLSRTSHDICLQTPNNIHLELHFNLIDDSVTVAQRAVLAEICAYAESKSDSAVCIELPDEMFYFYHIAHMAKHFEMGGCGIKPFLDLWILNHRVAYDRESREALLEKGGLLTFAKAAEKLSQVWFSGAETDNLSGQLEQYILDGGVYGTLKNNIAVKQAQTGGKFQYLLYKIWLPYNIIKYYYPVLQTHKWLIPVCQARRWFRLVFRGGLDNAVRTVKINANTGEEERLSTRQLLDELGL